MRRALSVFFILFFSIYIVTLRPAYAVKKEQPPNVIPLYTSSDGLFVFDVTINDTDTFPAILDTAAGMSALRANKLSQLNAPKTNQNRLVHGLIAKEVTETYDIEKISSGPLSYSGHVLSITDHDAISDPLVQGLIGTDIIGHHQANSRYVLIDFINQTIRTSNKMSDLVNRSYIRSIKWNKFKYANGDTKLLIMPVKIANIRATAILDTGITFSVINSPLAKKLNKRGRATQVSIYSDVNGEETELRHLFMDRMKSSSMTWGPTRVVINDPPALTPLNMEQDPVILLGLNYLKKTSILIDRKSGKMAFSPILRDETKQKICTGSRLACTGQSVFSYSPGRKNSTYNQ